MVKGEILTTPISGVVLYTGLSFLQEEITIRKSGIINWKIFLIIEYLFTPLSIGEGLGERCY